MDETEPDEQYKVGRVLSEYGLDALHRELAPRWLGEDRDAQSLRTLADVINVAVLEAAMEEAGLDPLDGEAENAYRLLTDDDVSTGTATQQRRQLERDGVDVEAVERDFVTHQAVHTYLTTVLEVTKEDEPTDAVETSERRINRLQSRTEAVTADALDGLQSADELTIGDFDVVVDVQAYCHDCGSQYPVARLVERGGCDCSP